MDDSFPIILINKNVVQKGNIKELTILELNRETNRLFQDEFSRSTVEYIVDDDNAIPLEEDDDLETEWDAINPESDSDDSDESDDEDKEEEKPKTALRMRVLFTLKKIEMKPPHPVAVRITNIKSTTAIFQWKISTIHNLNQKQISSLQFQIQQISPSNNNNNNLVAKCNPIIGSDKCYQIKVSGLHPITNYKFSIRSVLSDNNKMIYSASSDVFDVLTTKDVLMEPNQIPREIPPPSDLQIIALYPTSATLVWNHTAIHSLKQYDFEYYIQEEDVFAGGTAAATEDNNIINIQHLIPSTQYTFVCKAKYYDPQRKLSDAYYQNNQIISLPTNAVTITTPEQNTNANHYCTRSIDKVRWTKRGNELELFWSAPESFYGRIEYVLIDKIQNKVLGTANKLPVTISTGDASSIFGTKSGKFVITIKPIYIDGDDEKAERVEAKPYDIQITIDEGKEDASSQSMLALTVRFESKDTQRTIKIDTTNCDFDTFKQKLFHQFKLTPQRLKISIRIPSVYNNSLETMDITGDTLWQSFINNHSETCLRQNKAVYCFIDTMDIKVDSPASILTLSVRFESKDTQRTIQIDTTNCDFNTFKQKLFDEFKLSPQQLKISIRIPSPYNNSLETMDINNDTLWQRFIHNHSETFLGENKTVYCFIETMITAPSYLEVKSNAQLNQFEIDFKSGDAQKYCGQVEAIKDPSTTAHIDLTESYNYVQGARKPLIYVVQSQHKYLYFRFRIKCRTAYMDSAYSEWTQWHRLNVDNSTYNYNEYASSSIFPLQQSASSDLDENRMKPKSVPSTANNYNVSGGNTYQQATYNYNNNNNNNYGMGVLSGGGGSNDNNQNVSQFTFPEQQQNNIPMNDTNNDNKNKANNSGGSLNDLDYSGGNKSNNNSFWENF